MREIILCLLRIQDLMILCLKWIRDLFNHLRYTNEKHGRSYFSSLPDEIIVDILSRLPVESIKACKLVCSSWHMMSKTTQFAEMHLNRATPIILAQSNCGYDVEVQMFLINVSRTKSRLKKVCLKGMVVTRDTRLYASCNGLLLFKGYPNSIIWNPVTREEVAFYIGGNICGFFFHHLEKEYKLLNWHSDRQNIKYYSMYGLSTKELKRLDSPPCFPHLDVGPAVAAYGALFWRVMIRHNYTALTIDSYAIMMFNLDTEIFQVKHHPVTRSRRGSKDMTMRLLNIDGKLSSCNVYAMAIEVWILEDLRSWRWVKNYVVDLDRHINDRGSYDHKLLGILNGNLLFHWPGNDLLWINLRLNTVRKIKTGIEDAYGRLYGTEYIKSFVSLRDNNILS